MATFSSLVLKKSFIRSDVFFLVCLVEVRKVVFFFKMLLSSFNPCKTHPSDTIQIKKIILTEKTPIKDGEVNENYFICTNINRNEKSVNISDSNANTNENSSIKLISKEFLQNNVTNGSYPTINDGENPEVTYDGQKIFRVIKFIFFFF